MRLTLLIAFLLGTYIAPAQEFNLLIGTYTGTGSKGIYVYRFNAKTGKATWLNNTDSTSSPSYLVVSNNEKFVYAVNETNGANPGRVSAFSFNNKTGSLTLLNSEAAGGDDPCHLSITRNNEWLTSANYSGGNVSVFHLNKNGSLKPLSQLIQDSGSSANKERQEKAHVHQAVFSPDEKYLFTPDLGIDKVMIYKFNAAAAEPLSASSPASLDITAGSGPRHLTFHPNKKFAYLISELSGTVTGYRYSNGRFTEIETIITHPKAFAGNIGSAEIITSPDGKFLYASNRGDENTITIFSINPASGRLKLLGYQTTLGKAPRNFIIDPTGNYLLAANQDSDNIVIFKINRQTGLLKAISNQIHVPKPVCLQMTKVVK